MRRIATALAALAATVLVASSAGAAPSQAKVKGTFKPNARKCSAATSLSFNTHLKHVIAGQAYIASLTAPLKDGSVNETDVNLTTKKTTYHSAHLTWNLSGKTSKKKFSVTIELDQVNGPGSATPVLSKSVKIPACK